MKLPLYLLLAWSAVASAAEQPNGFLGILWGASPEEAKRILQKRPGIVFPENADDYRIEFTGGTFAGQPAAKWVIEFPERKFASASVTLKIDGDPSSIYKEFRNQLVAKYGSSTSEKNASGSSGSKRTPGATHMAVWKFRPSMKNNASVLISAELSGAGEDSPGIITIKYMNETLTGAAVAGGKPAAKPGQPVVKKDDL